jgi:hypothetical protein
MLKWVSRVVLIGLGLAAGGGLLPVPGARLAVAQGPSSGGAAPPGSREQSPPLPPDQRAAYLLHQAHDTLTLASIWAGSKRAKLPEAEAQLVDRVREFYRTAHRAYRDKDYARATALAAATIDGSRGLMSALHANTAPEEGVPAPPDIPVLADQGEEAPPAGGRPAASRTGGPAPFGRPQEAAREILRVARERILAAEKADAGQDAARPFLDASRQGYEDSRQAYKKGSYTKAFDLAVAAEAWTHIGEHLRRAQVSGRTGAGGREGLPPPEEQADQPLPPRRPAPTRQPPPER